MSSDLEARLRAVRPVLPEPGDDATARARAAVLRRSRARGVGAARWAGARSARLLVAAALVATTGGALAAALLREGAARAAPSPPIEIGRGTLLSGRFGGFTTPAVAVSRNGEAVLAWLQGERLDARLSTPDAGWSPAETLSRSGAIASGPAAAMDGQGAATVVWRERHAERVLTRRLRLPSGASAGVLRARAGERYVVVARSRPAVGRWGPLEEISTPSPNSRDGAEPKVAIARDGTTVAAWPMGRWIEVRSRARGGAWSAPTRLDAGGIAVQVRLAVDPSGAAALVWSARRRGPSTQLPRDSYVVRAVLHRPGTAWGAPLDVSERLPYAPGGAAIAVDARLGAAVVWGRMGEPTPGSQQSQVEGAVRGTTGWSAPHPLDPHAPAPPPGALLWPRATVGLDGNGTAVVVFNRTTGPAFTTLGSDGTPSPALPAGGRLTSWETLEPDGTGNLVLVLRTRRGLAVRTWRPGRGWTPPRTVAGSSKGSSPALAAEAGAAILAWVQFRGTGSTPFQVRAALGGRARSTSPAREAP